MSKFELHKYSGMAYESKQIITFSGNPAIALADVDEEMKFHTEVSAVEVCNLTQDEFDYFVSRYGDNYESIYFYNNTKIKDLSALSNLKKIKYLLFYNVRGTELWDTSKNESLKGIMISDSKKMLYDLEQLQYAPNLEELLLFSTMFNKYPVKTIEFCGKDFNSESKSESLVLKFSVFPIMYSFVFRPFCNALEKP